MPDADLRILCTRPLQQMLVEKAAANGIGIEVVPFIDTIFIEEKNLQPQITPLLQKSVSAVFTSTNAVRSVARFIGKPQPGWNIYCLSESTKDTVTDCFGASSIIATANDGEGLANILASEKAIDEIVFFCGNIRRNTIPQTLKQHNKTVHEIVVYETKATPIRLSQDYKGIAFFSPSAVDSFFSVNTISPETICYAIGNTTAASILQHTQQNKIQISAIPSGTALIDLIINTIHA